MNATILLVEDDPGMQDLMRRGLKGLGAEIVMADTMSEAILAMNKVPPPDLIFLDLGLPDSLTSETILRIPDLQALNPLAPIIVLTGNVDEKIEQAARQIGAHGFRLKQKLTSQRDLWTAIKEAAAHLKDRGIAETQAFLEIEEVVDGLIAETSLKPK